MNLEKVNQQLVHQEIALDTYLSNLLEDIPAEPMLEQKKAKKSLRSIKKPISRILPQPQLQPNSGVNQSLKSVEKQAEKIDYPLTILPEWAQHEFQALFFRVDQMILATPLVELLKTIKIDKEPTKISGQPSWFMGLLDVQELRVGILDMGQMVFGKMKGQQRDLKTNPFERILITLDGKWGLACDEVLSIGKLEPKNVRWRSMRKKRPWLIGTVIDELITVVDVKQLVPHRSNG